MKNGLLHASLFLVVGLLSCSSEENASDNNCNPNATCFTCTNCAGQYGHLIDGTYCVDGFDNCADWEQAKTNYETTDSCTCNYD